MSDLGACGAVRGAVAVVQSGRGHGREVTLKGGGAVPRTRGVFLDNEKKTERWFSWTPVVWISGSDSIGVFTSVSATISRVVWRT